MNDRTGATDARPRLCPRPITAPWLNRAETLFSWETAYDSGSASGVSHSENAAMRAVTEILRACGGEGLVQKCRLSAAERDDRDQYAYGDVVGRARVEDGIVVWVTP